MEKYPHKILVVEDETAMLNALTDNLLAAGFGHVLQARNGEDGLSVASRERPDLILLDIVMPKMDGLTMLKRLRQDPHGKNTKVIIMTNLTSDEPIMRRLVADEPSYYIVKTDHSIEDVIQKVKETLNIEG